jgi:RNA recognition motif-containing protein
MNIFVGNLSTKTTEKELEGIFSPFGQIASIKVITDNYTKQSRGFAFVEMPEKEHAEKAIGQLNNSSLDSQTITVNEARPKTSSNNGFNRKRF